MKLIQTIVDAEASLNVRADNDGRCLIDAETLRELIAVMVDDRHMMVLSNRKWKPEQGWCAHDWRTYVIPTPKDPTKGIRFHGQAEDFGVLLETKPRCLPIDAPRKRRRPEVEKRAPLTDGSER